MSASGKGKPLPKGWRWARLGDVATINPKRVPFERTDTEPTTFVPMPAVDEKSGTIAEAQVRPYGEVKRGYTCFAEGDVLFAKITPCMQNGKHAIASNLLGGIGFGSTEFHVIRPSSDVVSVWVHSYVRQTRVLQAAQQAFTGAVGQQRVPPEFLRDLVIPIPPIPEQRRIANLLHAAAGEQANARYSAASTLDELDRLEAAAIRSLIQVPISVDREDDAPDGWRWHLLTEVARLESGHTPSRRHPEWWGGSIPWIALPDIRGLDRREAFDTREMTNEAGLANSSARLLPAGTVVLSRTASVGFVTVMGRPMATSQDFVNWVCGPKLLPWFLAYALIASRARLQALSEGAIHKTIYMPTLRSLRICLPSIAEQGRIVAEIDALRATAAEARIAAAAQLAAIDSLPGTLLAAAFRGDL